MDDTLKSISCDPQCGFMVKSHSEKEVVDIARQHAKSAHKMDMSTAETKKMVKTEKM